MVFPAYVGMSPPSAKKRLHQTGVPRIRGDEPMDKAYNDGGLECSPHTWG
ncbi:hypothetical protein RA11412_1577 [Rothia aeria]|uniref:Uncharacterized protein n=1 Tax=Rothia aeria TaxID=172042 RepID=A0A2Z5QZT8_9MICC|nr:hypothetical protein RA11412_1577 [Rothia aeria]